MDDVKEFNNELSSLYSVKPPISKAKMNSITRLALKSLKHYKHIVQSIEKFIHKCQPEYKLPGLYVIDSIVRQSRHQFGIEKDPFVARFSRNIAVTFHDLLSCPTQEICKIVRVLNLWQKNSMFSPHIIQPLLDMAATPASLEVYLNAQKSIQQVTGIPPSSGPQHQVQSRPGLSSFLDAPASTELSSCDPLTSQPADLLKAISSQLLLPFTNPQLYVQLLQQQLLLQQAASNSLMPDLQQQSFVPQIDSNLLAQLHALTAALVARIGGPQQQQNQQATVTTTTVAGTSALDTTNDSLQSSDFHGDGTSPVFSNKKAGMSDILTDTEDDKAADQMSISSISTPAINQSENMDSGTASCPAYSPSADHADTHLAGHHNASDISGIASTSLPLSSMMTSNTELFSRDRQQQDHYGKASQDSGIPPLRSTQKNDYTLFSPVSPINSVPNSPSEDSGTPVLDEMPSPKSAYEPEMMMDEEEDGGCGGKVEKHSRKRTLSLSHEGSLSGSKRESLGGTATDGDDPSKSRLNQTPEEGEIVANEVKDDVAVAGSVNGSCGGRHRKKKSRHSRDKKEKLRALMSPERDIVPEIPTVVEMLPGTDKEVEVFLKKKDSSKKKKKKNRERHDSASKLVLSSKSLHGQSSSNIMVDGSSERQVVVTESKPRRYYVVLDEISDKMVTTVEKERELKRKRSPSPVLVFSKVHMSRREVFRGRSGGSGREERDKLGYEQIEERMVEKRSRSDYKSDHDDDDGVKDKKRRRHSKEHPHSKRDKSMSSLIEKVEPNPPTSNGPSHSSNLDSSSSRSLKRQRSKSPRKKSPRKDSRPRGHNRSRSKGDVSEPSKPEKTLAKNRIYRTKSVSAEPVSTPSADKSSRSGEKRSKSGDKRKGRKDGGGSKKSKRSPSKSKDQSTPINIVNNIKENKEVKSKLSHSKNNETEVRHHEKFKTKKDKRNKSSSSPSAVQKDACSSSTDFSKKEKFNLPPQKEKHACISSTTLWIGPVSRHTKKEDLRKELHKSCKPTLIDLVTKQSCVFVAFETRKEAVDLMEAFNNRELCGKTVKVTWAPGSGIKQSKFLDRWDVDIGATYIPWEKLPYNMEAISQGGILDTTSIPEQPTSSNNKENTQVAEASSSTDCQVIDFENNVVEESTSVKKPKTKLKETEEKLELQTFEMSSKKTTDDQSTKKSSRCDLGNDGSSSDRGRVRERTSSNMEVFITATIPPPPPPATIKLYESEPGHVVCIPDDGDIVREVVNIDEDDVEVIEGSQSFEVVEDDKHPVEMECSASEKNIKISESSSWTDDETKKFANGGKFSFSIDAPANPEKVEVGAFKNTLELENEADSTVAPSADKQLEPETSDEFSQIIENTGQLGIKSVKIGKSESEKVILKGKIKFGVKSAFSGWAMKHKMAVAAAAASAEEKSKEDTKNLFESLMERINSKPKAQFTAADDPNVNATFDEDFLSSIKIPSPKVVTTSVGIKSGIQDRKQSDMSDAYDPFEVDSDPGCNSPALKIISTSQSQFPVATTTRSSLSMTMPACGPRPLVSIYPFTPLAQVGISPSLVTNFMVPMFQPPPLCQNTPPFRGLSMPAQNMPSISAPGMAPSLGNIASTSRQMQPNVAIITTSAGFNQALPKPFISSLPPPPLPPSFIQQQEQLQKAAATMRPSSMPVSYSQQAAAITGMMTSPFASMHGNVSTSKISGHAQSFTVPPPILPHTARFPSSQFFASSDAIKHLPNTNLPPPPLKTITPLSSPFSLQGLHASSMMAGPSITHSSSSFVVPSQPPSQSVVSVSQSIKRPPLLAEPSTSVAASPNTQSTAKLMPNVWLQNHPRPGLHVPLPMISNQNQPLASSHSSSVSASLPIPCFPAAQHMESNKHILPPGLRPSLSQSDLNCRNIPMASLQPLLPSPCKTFDQFVHLSNPQDPKTSQSSDLAPNAREPWWTERNAGKERGLLDMPKAGSTASQIPVICHSVGASSNDKGRDGKNLGSSILQGPDKTRSQDVNDVSTKKDDCIKNVNNRTNYHPLLKTPPEPESSFDKSSSFDNDLHSEHNKTKPSEPSSEPIYKIESVISSGKQPQGESAESSDTSPQKPVFQGPRVSERLPIPTGFFSVPPPAFPMPNRGGMVPQDISALVPTPQRPPLAIQEMRPHTIGTAQEFSKLLNSPVTFDNFSKTLPHRSGAGTNPNVGNPTFSQRATLSGAADSLLGPPPPISLSQAPPRIGKMLVNQPPPSTQGLPNDFNKNFPPPPLPQMGGLNIRNVLFPNPSSENKNMDLRYGPLPSLLGASDFFGNIQVNRRNDFIQRPNLRHETADQSRRNLGRPDVNINFDCPQRFSGPRRPAVDYAQGQKRWPNNNITRFN